MTTKFTGGNSNCKHEIDLSKTYQDYEYGCKHCTATIFVYPMVVSQKQLLEVEIESLETLGKIYDDVDERLKEARDNLQKYLQGDQEPYLQEYINNIKRLIKKHNAPEFYKEYLEKAEKDLKQYQEQKKK